MTTNAVRRSRGYNFENDMVKKVNGFGGWHARRFGGASTHMPDVIMTNNEKSIIAIMEAKAGTGESLNVDKEQLEKCLELQKMFSVYESQFIMLAFKFMSKNKDGKRPLKMYFYPYNYFNKIEETPSRVSCNYKGEIFINRKKIYQNNESHTITDLITFLQLNRI